VSMRKKTGTKHVDRRGDDLTEDIDFWTRMTQATGSMPPIRTPIPTRQSTPRPTPRPVVAPDPLPTYSPTDPDTPSPTTESPVSSSPTNSPSDPFPCGISPNNRAEQFRQLALTVTDDSTLSDATSSQARALNWILNEDVLDPPLCPDDGTCRALQRYIMASFYFASDGGSWDECNAPNQYTPAAIATANAQCGLIVTPFPVNNARLGDKSTNAWLTPVNECEWGGVACWGTDDARFGCMDQIDFEGNGLAGTLIPEMNNLEELRFFILEQGDVSGGIPTEYGLFSKLLIFDMDFNELTGTIPAELFNMNLLQQLDLNDNKLTGAIPSSIGNLKTLTFLQLDHNELDGNIPTEVGELKALRIGFFNDNDLTGVMPAEVCANRNNTSPPGLIGTLVADCNPPSDPEVECPCCSSCNVLN